MSYIDVIPLAEMRTYLRIDDTQNETDSEITSMINAACRYVEKRTNHLFFEQDKIYYPQCDEVRVYDYPINSDTSEATIKPLYALFCDVTEPMTLNVGYELPADVPDDLKNVVKVLVSIMFYQQESEQSFIDSVPAWVKEIINANRRFTL